MIERCMNKKEMKNKKYRKVKIFTSDMIYLFEEYKKKFNFKFKNVKKYYAVHSAYVSFLFMYRTLNCYEKLNISRYLFLFRPDY